MVPFASHAQLRQGVYKAPGATAAPWSINANHTLIWDGKPYLPFGMRIDGTPAAVLAAQAAGIHDVVVDLPASGAGWDETLAALAKADMRYLLRIDSLSPMAPGFAVEPQAYRITGITSPRTVTVSLPGASSAFVILASRRDSSIASSGRVPVVNGKLVYDAKPAGEIEHVLLIYPETLSLEQIDCWEALDVQRDALLSTLKRHTPGAGLRGIINPIGRSVGVPENVPEFVPTSPYFRMEYRDLLEKRYHSIKTAMTAWGMGANDLETFDDLARLVPLWQNSRGVGLLLDPKTNKTYPAEAKRNIIWADIAEAVNTASPRRLSRFIAAVRSVVNVPVIQEWAGWSPVYETPNPAVDGVGMRAAGTGPQELIDAGSPATSSVTRWLTAGWLPATDIDLEGAENAATQLPAVLDDLGSLGARGFFLHGGSPALIKALVSEADKRKENVALAAAGVQALYFPENAKNPATAQRLPFGLWWLPCPADGNRIDMGSQFFAYRMRGAGGNFIVLWAKQAGRYRLRMINPKIATFKSTDGHDPDPKLAKGGVDINLTDIPLIVSGTDEIPVPELALAETMFRFDFMMTIAQKLMKDISEERIFFRDQVASIDRNPGGSLTLMRVQLARLGAKVGDVVVAEAEKISDTNFSEVDSDPGCSGGGALVLHTPLTPESTGYYAQFTVISKTKDEQEVWIAASIPLERRADITVTVNGQTMSLPGAPAGSYGDGFGWYKLGVTRLGLDPAKVRIQINGAASSPIAIDSLVFSPRPFVPNGPNPPDAVIFPAMPKK